MTDMELFLAFIKQAGLENNIIKHVFPIASAGNTCYELDEGNGYSGFSALFVFDEAGKLKYHSVAE